jgi:arginine decarboxylase-like protein
MTTTAADELLKKLELHRSLKDASPGFHLSDEDIDVIIALLREDPKRLTPNTIHISKQGRAMTSHNIERVLGVVRQKRSELKAAGIDEYDVNLQPLICSMLETLLQHEADKQSERTGRK